MSKHEYNLTHLNPEEAFNRHIFHRDQFAHYLRWTHVLKIAKIGQSILDFGSGTGELLEVLYRNKYKQNKYVGLEYSKSKVDNCLKKYDIIDWASFIQCDIIKDVEKMNELGKFDVIVSFEVVEHVNKINVDKFFNNMKMFCHDETIVLISTPVYDEDVGPAKNHIINNVIQEFSYNELKDVIERNGFEIIDVFGTFASQKDYKKYMNEWQSNMFNHLVKYYDSNLVSNLMAPFFPEQSRNCLWKLKLKNKKIGDFI